MSDARILDFRRRSIPEQLRRIADRLHEACELIEPHGEPYTTVVSGALALHLLADEMESDA